MSLAPSNLLSYGAIAATTDPVLVVDANTRRQSVTIGNNDESSAVFIGDENVTIATGLPIGPNKEHRIDGFTGRVYVVCSGPADVRFFEVG